MTYKELLKYGEQMLCGKGIVNYAADAWLLFQYVFKINRLDYLMEPQKAADEKDEEHYRECIKVRGGHYPLQYITHGQNFMGLDFYVDERVLIPRQDTEVLAEQVLRFLKDGMSVLDMCTGSGCIITSLAANRKLSRAVGADLSVQALEVAAGNAVKNGQNNIEFIQSDLFENIRGKFDVIVSNPPYIPSEEIETLMPEVKSCEPRMALDGSSDGLLFYRKIISSAAGCLCEDGMLFFEIGWDQAEAVRKLLAEAGYTGITVKKDLAGLDRVVYAVSPSGGGFGTSG